MPRKKSVKRSAREFKARADEIAAFVTDAEQKLTAQQVSWAYDYSILRLYREFEALMLEALVGAINNDTATIAKSTGITFPKHLTDEVCEYLIIGNGYFDFKGRDALIKTLKEYVPPNHYLVRPAIYVGEAESIKARVKSHVEKDFWNHLVYFVSKDENLTKSHIRYLEGRLINQAQAAERAVVANGQSSGAKLPESDREDMEVFLQKINQLLPVLGVDLLVAVSTSTGRTSKRELFICEIKGLRAHGRPVPNGFLVLKESEAVHQERPSVDKWPWPRAMRQKLVEDSVLLDRNDRLVFAKDVEFSSPSAAAAVIHGGHANGLTAWKASDGRTLKEVESS